MFFANPDPRYPWPERGSLGDVLFNTNYDTAWMNLLQQYGLAYGQDPLSQWARGLGTRSQQGYETSVPQKGLGYTYTDYLRENYPKIFEDAWNTMSPSQQGLNSATPGIGRTRYVGWPTG